MVAVNIKKDNKRVRLGILANEFFDPAMGRMGGFGWAAHKVVGLFNNSPELGIDPILLSGEHYSNGEEKAVMVHDTKMILRSKDFFTYNKRLHEERLDLLLTIDYRANYLPALLSLPRIPVIVWVRDPRTQEDARRVRNIRIPGQENVIPQGLNTPKTRSLSFVVKHANFLRRPMLLTTSSAFLSEKVPGAYGIHTGELPVLPNIIDFVPNHIVKSKKPQVVFLGRLDPIKRPWLFVELAKRFPQVEFILLGQRHFFGPGSWSPENLPDNVRFAGHTGEEEKLKILASAWVFVNTSFHESLPVSFLEALKCEVPIIASVNPDGVVSRYGKLVDLCGGTGLDSLPDYKTALSQLLSDRELRTELGKEGCAWVSETHTADEFLNAFSKLCQSAGVDLPMEFEKRGDN